MLIPNVTTIHQRMLVPRPAAWHADALKMSRRVLGPVLAIKLDPDFTAHRFASERSPVGHVVAGLKGGLLSPICCV